MYNNTSSKGNQPKYVSADDYWYKQDCLGYEALSESIVSYLLEYSNVHDYVQYMVTNIESGIHVHTSSESESFVKPGESLITLHRFFRNMLGVELHKEILKFSETTDRIRYVVDTVESLTDIQNFGKYITTFLELDAFTLDDDRHFNNIALLKTGNEYRLPPYFDFGAAFLSDITMEYPLSEKIESLIEKCYAKPFSSDFSEQVDAAEALYGVQLKIYCGANDLCSYVDSHRSYYSETIIERVKELIRIQFRKYQYLIDDSNM